VRTVDRYVLQEIRDAREPRVLSALSQQRELGPVVREFIDLPVIQLDGADHLRRPKQPPALASQSSVRREAVMIGKPGRNCRASHPVAVARPDFLGGILQSVTEIKERDRVEHDPERIRLVAQRRGRRREHTLARGTTPQLHYLDLLAARSLARDRGASAARTALRAVFGVRNAC